MVDTLRYFSIQPVLHDWYNKGRGMCYPAYGMVHKKEPLLLIEKSSPCKGGGGFPLSLSKWSFTIRKYNVLSALLNKTFPSFLPLPSSERKVAHGAISRSSQCSTTGVTKAVVCSILSANRKE